MKETYQPVTEEQTRQWRQKYGVRMFDYELIPFEKLRAEARTKKQETPESKLSAGLMFILALLSSLIDLPTGEDFGIEGEGEIETPQSTLMAKS